jgi:hypothetical protein
MEQGSQLSDRLLRHFSNVVCDVVLISLCGDAGASDIHPPEVILLPP